MVINSLCLAAFIEMRELQYCFFKNISNITFSHRSLDRCRDSSDGGGDGQSLLLQPPIRKRTTTNYQFTINELAPPWFNNRDFNHSNELRERKIIKGNIFQTLTTTCPLNPPGRPSCLKRFNTQTNCLSCEPFVSYALNVMWFILFTWHLLTFWPSCRRDRFLLFSPLKGSI